MAASHHERLTALDFRALVPVNIRTEDESGQLGNRVATVAAALPLGEPDPRQRLARVVEAMGEVKASRQVGGMEMMQGISEWGLAGLFTQFARLTAISRPFNMVVTNVPGPQVPMYLHGARLLETYPHVPLVDQLGLGIALLSYDGKIGWGFNADYDLVPDLDQFVEDVRSSFAALQREATDADAAAEPSAPRSARSRKPNGRAQRDTPPANS